MEKIYACLTGNWVCLNDDPECVMGENHVNPHQWYKENAVIWAPIHREEKDAYYQLDYIKIFYHGKDYRINPIFIQIVSE